MQTGFVLFYFLFPTISDQCCGKTQRRTKGDKNAAAKPMSADQHYHYKVVEGEVFVMPCNSLHVASPIKWFKATKGKECGKEFVAEMEDSGTYSSLTGSYLTLQVINKTSLRCFQPNESSVTLLVDAGGEIRCPGRDCYNNTAVVWYKKNKTVSEQSRISCENKGLLHLCTVYESDTGVYYCDRQITEQGVMWTFRRAVNVTVIPHSSSSPEFKYPSVNMTEKVELGQPHTLECEVIFDVEEKISQKVQWFMNFGGDIQNMTLLHMEQAQVKPMFPKVEVTQKSIIKEVMPQHLKHTYTCFASNAVGNNSVTIKLQKKMQVKWPSLVGYPFACFLLVAGLGIIVHVKWLELQLIFRSHFQFGKLDGEEKQFDIFVSYVWTVPSVEEANGLSPSSKPYTETGGCKSNMKMQSSEGPIEKLLPQVLENQWGYRVCLLERDILPGGAYTNDVVLTINSSRMLICVLSAEYFANSNAVFVLESGVKALLQMSAPKMLLIWTGGTSSSFIQPEPPLPKLVQRALKVLPSLQTSTDTSPTAIRSFWTSLQKAMPAHGARLASQEN
ncbi:interleukin-18 receptor accessory protein-like isoform X1 [Girardinichthys multiradiatus]|uniref:interleukin-18 receptor accessory protein-like isoform X1 n=1 Tax=Girardinichthys multiradiatus TaxID=208333 RepID=UPI001FAB7099|nr:interleukin-18 receptor accessory protein-like isoform X1 [Girardinichthys multiradiatus]